MGGEMHQIHHRTPSAEYFEPGFASPRRQATLSNAVFSLVSTIVGGGCLSLPYMLKETGILMGFILVLVVALASGFALDLLISCSRRHQRAITFEAVAKAAFGRGGYVLSLLLLFALLYLAIIAYLILIRDLFPPIVEFLLESTLTTIQIRILFIAAVILLFPLCMARSLQSLSFTSTISVMSMLMLSVVIAVRGSQSANCTAMYLQQNFVWPASEARLLSTSGIAVCSFCCVFNTLGVHSSLILPTRKRVRQMLHSVMALCCVIYLAIALGGLCLAGFEVQGNILLNFDSSDPLATMGRCGLLITVVFSFPLLVLPCRDVCYKIAAMFNPFSNLEAIDDPVLAESPELTDRTPLLSPPQHLSAPTTQPSRTFWPTFLIVSSAVLLSLTIKSVAVCWILLGGSVSVLLSLTLPSAFYLRIRWNKPFGPRHVASIIMLITSVAFIIANTTELILHFSLSGSFT